jgi:hypothetical protein
VRKKILWWMMVSFIETVAGCLCVCFAWFVGRDFFRCISCTWRIFQGSRAPKQIIWTLKRDSLLPLPAVCPLYFMAFFRNAP